MSSGRAGRSLSGPARAGGARRPRPTGTAVTMEAIDKEVPLQVMVPNHVRRQVAIMSASEGASIRVLVLRALQAIGVEVPNSEMVDRRGRRRS